MSGMGKWGYYASSLATLGRGIVEWYRLPGIFLNRKSDKVHQVTTRSPRFTFQVRGGMDVWSVKETVLDDFYSKVGTQVQPGWTVVDIGAAIGEFTVPAASRAGARNVFAFEPNPRSFKLLQENLAANGLQEVSNYPYAVWSADAQLAVDPDPREPLQALISETSHGQTVQALSLATILSEIIKGPIDLLKSDSEGAEYAYLVEASDQTLESVKRIVMEYHDLDESRNLKTLRARLTAAGYQVTVRPNQVHGNIGYLYADRTGGKGKA